MSLERIEYRGHVILVESDDDPLNPRTDYDNAGEMICWHDRYTLGDKEAKVKDMDEALARIGGNFEGWDEFLERLEAKAEAMSDDIWSKSGRERAEAIREYDEFVNGAKQEWLEKRAIILPLYLYDHSGVTMNTTGFSCGWDSGMVGLVWISRKDAVKEWGKVRCTAKVVKRAEDCLKCEVETYDQYIRGDVYGYKVLGPLPEGVEDNGEDSDDERDETDSCWGYFGEYGYKYGSQDSDMIQEAKGAVDFDLDRKPQLEEERQAKALLNAMLPDIEPEAVMV